MKNQSWYDFNQSCAVKTAGQNHNRFAGPVNVALLLALLSLACGINPLARSEVTPTRPLLAIEVTVMVRAAADGAAPPTGQPVAAQVIATPAAPPVTDTPFRSPTLSPSPTPTPLPPQAAPLPTIFIPTPALPPVAAPVVVSTPAAGFEVSPRLPFQGSINLIAPENNLSLPATTDQLEVKWSWQGTDQKLARCETLEEYGFEVRIDPPQPHIGPLGVMDAARNLEDRAQGLYGCDPETGLHTYLITFLKDKPGVKSACGMGKFLVDVALVQLNPYEPLLTSQAHIFEITPNYQGSLDPFGEPLTCSDFDYWVEAQALFYAAGGPSKDPHNLDPDGNGRACDDLCTPE